MGVLRMTLAQLKDERIRLRKELTDEDVIRILAKAVKSRKDSVESYRSGGREDLAEKEAYEIGVLEQYLPEQMSEDDVRAVVAEIISQTGAGSMKDMGKVMGPAMARLKGQADGKMVQDIVRALLGN